MNVTQIKSLTKITKGVEVTGQITKIFNVKEHDGQYGKYTTQSFVIEDSTDDILCSLYSKKLSEDYLNKVVTLSNATARTYKDKEENTQHIVDVKKGSNMFFAEGEEGADELEAVDVDTTTKSERKVTKKPTFGELMLTCTAEIASVLTSKEFKKTWHEMSGPELTSEDIRAFIISNIISKQRG